MNVCNWQKCLFPMTEYLLIIKEFPVPTKRRLNLAVHIVLVSIRKYQKSFLRIHIFYFGYVSFCHYIDVSKDGRICGLFF
jgi:hypothetical protein